MRWISILVAIWLIIKQYFLGGLPDNWSSLDFLWGVASFTGLSLLLDYELRIKKLEELNKKEG